MAKKKATPADQSWVQAWEVSMDLVKPYLKLQCPTCKRKVVYRMGPKDLAPFCVKCMDAMMGKMGIKRMKVVGTAKPPKETTVVSWTTPKNVGKVAKKGRKP